MKIAIKFFEKVFKGEDSKDVYLKACKWIAKNVISTVEIGETFWRIEKERDTDLPTFKLELYAMLDANETGEKFCIKCKEFHRSFFINQDFNCSRCNMKTYKNELEDKLSIKKQWRKERLKYILEK